MSKVSVALEVRLTVVVDIDMEITYDPYGEEASKEKFALTHKIKDAVDSIVTGEPYDGTIVDMQWR